MEITNDAASADVVIVNTCSFIDAAQEESVDAILESAEVREANNRGQGLIVSGCLPQRFREDLPKLLPEVDAFMGIDQVAQVSQIVEQAMAHRAARIATEHRTSNIERRTSKGKIVGKFAELQKGETPSSHDHEENIRGTDKFGKTKAVVEAQRAQINKRAIFDVTQRPVYIPDYETPRFRLTPKHFAYVKIAEGCNHPCSFCIIPQMRGSSSQPDSIGHR